MGGYPSVKITIADNAHSSELMDIMESKATGVRQRISSPSPLSTIDEFLQKYYDLLNLDSFILRQSQNQLDAFTITDINNREIFCLRNVTCDGEPTCCQNGNDSRYSLINFHGDELFQFTWHWADIEGQTVAGKVKLNSEYIPTRMSCFTLKTQQKITFLFRGRGYEAIELGTEPIRATEAGIQGYLNSDLSLIFRAFFIYSAANFHNIWYNKRRINREDHVRRVFLSGTSSTIGSGGWNAGNGGVPSGVGSFGGGSFGGGSIGGGSFGGGSCGGGSCGGGFD